MSAMLFRYLFLGVIQANVFTTKQDCPKVFEGKSMFQQHYLGGYLPGLEHLFCVLVVFFHPVLQPEAASFTPFMGEFAVSLAACVVVPFFEAARTNTIFWPGFAMAMGLVYQAFTAGVTFPIFWAILHVFGPKEVQGSDIKRGRAEAVMAGIILGYFVPTLVFLMLFPSVNNIALWQPFPVYITAVGVIYRFFRSFGQASYNTSGHRVVCLTYIFLFGIGATFHFRAWTAYDFNVTTLINSWIPPVDIPDLAKGHVALHGSAHFLQWDAVLALGSTFLSSLWFADNIFQAVGLLAWSAIGSIIFGPGAAISGIFLWREIKLHRLRKAVKSVKK